MHLDDIAQTGNAALQNTLQRGRLGLSFEKPASCQSLPGYGRDAEQVGTPVHGFAVCLLGRHVSELALHRPIACVGKARTSPGNPKVRNARAAIEPDQNVLRRAVTMHDVQVMPRFIHQLMGCMKAVERVDDHPEQQRRGYLRFVDGGVRQQASQGQTLDVFHHQVIPAFALFDLKNGHHVLMMNTRCKASLIDKHLDKLVLGRQVGMKAFDSNHSLEATHPGQACKKNRGHSSRGQRTNELVAPEEYRVPLCQQLDPLHHP